MIAAHVPNLMDRSRFGSDVRFVDSPSDVGGATTTVVDLDRCQSVAAFAELSCWTIGYCAHVDSDLMDEAAAAGFDEVLARSAFFRRLPAILAGAETPGSG